MSLKLALIGTLATVGVAGISTGGYFLLRNSSEEDKKLEQEPFSEESGGREGGTKVNEASGGGSVTGVSTGISTPQVPSATSGSGSEEKTSAAAKTAA